MDFSGHVNLPTFGRSGLVEPTARRRVTAPAVEPLTLAMVQQAARSFVSADDDLLNLWIAAARIQAEKISGQRFITQTWEYSYDYFPGTFPFPFFPGVSLPYYPGGGESSIKIEGSPVQSVEFIKYVDAAGVLQTFGTLDDSSPAVIQEYSLVKDEYRSQIALNYNFAWPQVAPVKNAVTIRVVLGFGDTAAAVPELFRAGMILLVGHFNENREAVVVDESRVQAIEIPLGIRDLLSVPEGA